MSLPKNYKAEPLFFHKRLKENATIEEKLFFELEKWDVYKNWTSSSACRLELAKTKNIINDILVDNLDLFFALHDDEYHKGIAEYCGIEKKPIDKKLLHLWRKNQESLIALSLW